MAAGRFLKLILGSGLTGTDNSDGSITIDAAGGGGSPTGSAGGALDGTYPNPGIAASVAGSGLSESSDVLAVNVDGSTVEISSDTVRVKDAGVTSAKLAAGAAASNLGAAGGDLTGIYPSPTLVTSGVSAATYGDSTHVAQVAVDAKGRVTSASSVTISGVGAGIPNDGWVSDSGHTWTYASGSGGGAASFTISGVDLTATFRVGMKLRLKQGGAYKYFYVTSSSFSTNTTVNIMAGTDYTLANSSITDNYYSPVENPEGFPDWFTWAPAPTGYTGSVTITFAKFKVIGHLCILNYNWTGTSNASTCTATAPVAANATSSPVQAVRYTVNTAPAGLAITASSTSLTFGTGWGAPFGGGFATSGAKALAGVYHYEI